MYAIEIKDSRKLKLWQKKEQVTFIYANETTNPFKVRSWRLMSLTEGQKVKAMKLNYSKIFVEIRSLKEFMISQTCNHFWFTIFQFYYISF